MKYYQSLLFVLIMNYSLCSQQTVGTIFLDSMQIEEGHTLFYPNNQSHVFLVDNCGELVNQWDLTEGSFAGIKGELDSLGNLYVSSANGALANQSSFGAGGAGGVIEKYDWNSNLIWRYLDVDSVQRQHHDFNVLPNGNILYIAWQRHFLEEIVEVGFDTLSHPQREIWSDSVIEYDPDANQIVWQWNSWDHLIQDFDIIAKNYGIVAQSLGRIDINYQDHSFGRKDWLHSNGIDYLESRDQIVLSVRNFNELWIIDHSTTSEEAATSVGGNSGKGGDLLYRWGDANTYRKDSVDVQRKSFWQHDPDWVLSEEGELGILFFNNYLNQERSEGQLIVPVYDPISQCYLLDQDSIEYLPIEPIKTYSHPDIEKTFSTSASSIQQLPNNNILMCAARQGRIFEITQEGDLVWEYLVPLKAGIPIVQGFELSLSDNFTFQASKYPVSYSKVQESLGETIEIGSLPSYCDIAVSNNSTNQMESLQIKISPNPSNGNSINIDGLGTNFMNSYSLFNLSGIKIRSGLLGYQNTIDISDIKQGVYILKVGNSSSKLVRL